MNKNFSQWYDQNCATFRECTEKMIEILNTIIKGADVISPFITGRVKDRDSFLEKIERKKYDDITQMTDIVGTRVIAYTIKDAETICTLIGKELVLDDDNCIDKAKKKEADQVGYLSTHLIVLIPEKYLSKAEYEKFKDYKCEIQIRTLLQHAWAEIEHGEYKLMDGTAAFYDMKRQFNLTAAMLEVADKELQVLSDKIVDFKRRKDNGEFKPDSLSEHNMCKYLEQRFSSLPISRSFNDWEEIHKELNLYGIESIYDFEKCSNEMLINHIFSYFEKNELDKRVDFNYGTLVRSFMIMYNKERYFTRVWDRKWVSESAFIYDMWESYFSNPDYLRAHISRYEV